MSQILNNISITTSLNKVVETTEGFILNGHYYDKATMTPQPLTTFETIGVVDDMCLSKRIVKSVYDSGHGFENYGRESLVITDNYDSDITYLIGESSRTNSITTNILKITEKDGTAMQILRGNVSIGYYAATYNNRIYDIIGQNQNEIFVLASVSFTGTSSGPFSAILSINKTTLAVTSIEQFGRYYISSKVFETPLYTFILMQEGKGALMCKRFNKMTAKAETVTVTSAPGTIAYHYSQASNGLMLEDGRFLVYSLSDAAGVITFTKRIIDPEDISLTTCAKYDEGVVDYTISELLDITEFPALASNYRNRHILEITSHNNKNYLNVFVYDLSGTVTGNIGKYGIYTFLITEGNGLELCGFTPMNGATPLGYILNNAKDGILSFTNNSLLYYLFNVEKQCWEEIYNVKGTITSAGFDMRDNIWYMDSLGNVEMLSPINPVSISLKMEEDNYQFDGIDIDTNILINAVNMDNEKIPATVKMTIKGSAIFTSTNTKTMTIVTNKGEDLRVPITVKDGGQIIIYPELII